MNSTQLPVVSFWEIGYDRNDVDRFMRNIRGAYESLRKDGEGLSAQHQTEMLKSSDIRAAHFQLRRGGYRIADVDAALDRIEDALSRTERNAYIEEFGEDIWLKDLNLKAERLSGRLRRPRGMRFADGRWFEQTYDKAEVDDLCERIDGYFNENKSLDVTEIRSATFASRRGKKGYAEHQVDAFLDATIAVIVSVA